MSTEPNSTTVTDDEVAIVRDILNATLKQDEEYCNDNVDHADGYAHIIDEIGRTGYEDAVEEWVCNNIDDYSLSEDCVTRGIDSICDGLDSSDADADNSGGPNGACCIYRFENGEQEVQIDVFGNPDLKEFHDRRVLDDILDQLDREFCISRSYPRVYSHCTNRYEEVGRKTYHHTAGSDYHPTFEVYHNPGGSWGFYVDAERMQDLFNDGVAAWNDDNPQDDDDDCDD